MSSFETETFDGEVGEPNGADKSRSAFATLKSLESNPLEQARKYVQYAAAADARKAKLAKMLTPAAQDVLVKYHPGAL